MKITKTLTILMVTLMLIIALVGCTTEDKLVSGEEIHKNLQSIHGEHFDVEVIEDLGGGNLIIVDKNTNVMYLFVKGFYASAMTPIYNADGTVKLYEE